MCGDMRAWAVAAVLGLGERGMCVSVDGVPGHAVLCLAGGAFYLDDGEVELARALG